MSEGKLFLKTENYNGYDNYYFRLNQTEKTWSEVLGHIETLLDHRFLNDNGKLEGIKINCEIVSLTEEEYANIDWDDI